MPVPEAADLETLNEQLLASATRTKRDTLPAMRDGRRRNVASSAITCCRWQPRSSTWPRSASQPWMVRVACASGRMRIRSEPKAGKTVQAKIYSSFVELWHENHCVGRHERSYGKYQQVLDLEHYLDVLEHKPGALAGSKPLEQCRQAGRWPAIYDQFWEGLIARSGQAGGDTRNDCRAETGSGARRDEA